MRQKVVLTFIWLGSFVISVLLVESYTFVHDDKGYVILTFEESWEPLKPLLVIYTSYLTGILAFWFIKPFKPARTGKAAKVRFLIALICTVIFNVVVMYWASHYYLRPHDQEVILDNLMRAATYAKGLSFLVAPVNVYYFGTRG